MLACCHGSKVFSQLSPTRSWLHALQVELAHGGGGRVCRSIGIIAPAYLFSCLSAALEAALTRDARLPGKAYLPGTDSHTGECAATAASRLASSL